MQLLWVIFWGVPGFVGTLFGVLLDFWVPFSAIPGFLGKI